MHSLLLEYVTKKMTIFLSENHADTGCGKTSATDT